MATGEGSVLMTADLRADVSETCNRKDRMQVYHDRGGDIE
jgi:hypothetical protein